MKIKKKLRKFRAGSQNILLKHCGNIFLKNDEVVTFVDQDASEYDICKKAWGYYATPSINSRLKKFKFKTVLVKNDAGKYFILLVKKNKIQEFKKYLKSENIKIICFLEEDKNYSKIKKIFNGKN